jgi:hypothetical protein
MKIVVLLCFFGSFSSFSQFNTKENDVIKKNLDTIIFNLNQTLARDWFIVRNKTGFTVNFCRSCLTRFQAWSDTSTVYRSFNNAELLEYFGPDSVHYCSTVNMVRSSLDSLEILKTRLKNVKNNGLLSFSVYIEPKWTRDKIRSVQYLNDSLKIMLKKYPMYRTNDNIFSDYRYWLPGEYWKNRLDSVDYYFLRLPYYTAFYDFSVFIVPDQRSQFSRVSFIQKREKENLQIETIELDSMIDRALHQVAITLGIRDFRIVGRRYNEPNYWNSSLKSDIELR